MRTVNTESGVDVFASREGPPRGGGRSRNQTVTWVPALGAGAGCAAALAVLIAEFLGSWAGLLAFSIGHLIFGSLVFARHGRWLITATGLYYLSTALFVGGAGIYVTSFEDVTWDSVYLASLAIFLANLLLYLVRFRKPQPYGHDDLRDSTANEAVLGFSRNLGLALLGLGVSTQLLGLELLGPIPHALAFSGVASLLVSFAVSVSANRRSILAAALVASIGLVLFVEFFFAGGGRLNIVALLLAGGLIVNLIKPRRWHKTALLALIIPFWILAGFVGVERGPGSQDATVEDVLVQGEGLRSGYNGLLTFAELIRLDAESPQRAFERQYGMTFADGLVASFPRALWAGKPNGFGFELTLLLLPDNASKGHSMVATAFGEWYVNFWWFGFVAIPLVLASLLDLVDRWQRRLSRRSILASSDVLSLLILAIVLGSIPNYVWGSFFSVMARAGLRVLLLLPIWMAIAWFHAVRRRVVA